LLRLSVEQEIRVHSIRNQDIRKNWLISDWLIGDYWEAKEYRIRRKRTFGIEQGISNVEIVIKMGNLVLQIRRSIFWRRHSAKGG